MKKMAIATLVALGFTAAAFAQQPSSPSQQRAPSSSQPVPRSPTTTPSTRTDKADKKATAPVSFDDADKDKDGKLTKREAKGVPNLKFSTADTDKDSAVSRQEFQTAMAATPRPRG